MNYYDEIKKELIDNEINKKVKNYSINKSDLQTYYNVGKMLSEAGKHYGDGIIKEYSRQLTIDLNIRYDVSKFYFFKNPLSVAGQRILLLMFILSRTYCRF